MRPAKAGLLIIENTYCTSGCLDRDDQLTVLAASLCEAERRDIFYYFGARLPHALEATRQSVLADDLLGG